MTKKKAHIIGHVGQVLGKKGQQVAAQNKNGFVLSPKFGGMGHDILPVSLFIEK